MSQWNGIERRLATEPLTLAELEVHIDKRIRAMLDEHTRSEAQLINNRFDTLEILIKSGFPGGDPSEHRRYHDEVLEFMRERRELWKSIREKTLTGLLWSMLVGGGTAIWHYVRAKLGGL